MLFFNMDKLGKYCATWRTTVDHTLYDSTYILCPKQAIPYRQSRWASAGSRGRREWGGTESGDGAAYGSLGNIILEKELGVSLFSWDY